MSPQMSCKDPSILFSRVLMYRWPVVFCSPSPLPHFSSVLCSSPQYPLSSFLNAHYSAFTATVNWSLPLFLSLSVSLYLCSTTAAPSITHMHACTHWAIQSLSSEDKDGSVIDTQEEVCQLHMHTSVHVHTHYAVNLQSWERPRRELIIFKPVNFFFLNRVF